MVGLLFGALILGPSLAWAYNKQLTVEFIPLKYYVNGVQKYPPAEQQGFIYNGSTYVPMRFMAEAAGLKVDWYDYDKSIYVTGGSLNNSIPGVSRTTSGVAITPYSYRDASGIVGGFTLKIDPSQFSNAALKEKAKYYNYNFFPIPRMETPYHLNEMLAKGWISPEAIPITVETTQQITGFKFFDVGGFANLYVQVIFTGEDGKMVGYYENPTVIMVDLYDPK